MTYVNFTLIESSARDQSLALDYKLKCKFELKNEKIEKIADGIAAVQKSIDWTPMDLRIANRGLRSADNPKVIVKDSKTKELLGYAILKPQENCWYISQIAVMKNSQRCGIGKAMMQIIFAKAREKAVHTISLDANAAEEKIVKFYQSFHSKTDGIDVRFVDDGWSRHGYPRIKIFYELRDIEG
jgi:ribosomal protein S18 acetylase RimI-like enzyme